MARKLAVKIQHDADWFDLDEINRLLAPEGHPNPPRAVNEADVLQWIVYHKKRHWSITG
jgi:hypothetical protein